MSDKLNRDSKAARKRPMTRGEAGMEGQLDQPVRDEDIRPSAAPRDSQGRVNVNSPIGNYASARVYEPHREFQSGTHSSNYAEGTPEREEALDRVMDRKERMKRTIGMMQGTYDPEEDPDVDTDADAPIQHTRPHRLLDMPLEVQKQRREGKSVKAAPQYQSPPAPRDMKDRMDATNAARQKVRDEADAQRRQQYERFSNYTDQVEELLSDEKSADQPLQPNPNRMSMEEQTAWVNNHFHGPYRAYLHDRSPENKVDHDEAWDLVAENLAEHDYLNNRDQKYLIRPSPFRGRKSLVPPCLKAFPSMDPPPPESAPRQPRGYYRHHAVQGNNTGGVFHIDKVEADTMNEEFRDSGRGYLRKIPESDMESEESVLPQPYENSDQVDQYYQNLEDSRESREISGQSPSRSPRDNKTLYRNRVKSTPSDEDMTENLDRTKSPRPHKGKPPDMLEDMAALGPAGDPEGYYDALSELYDQQREASRFRKSVKALRRLYGSKTLSSTNVNLGGALVAPPAQGRIVKLKRNKKSLTPEEHDNLRESLRIETNRRNSERANYPDEPHQFTNPNNLSPVQIQVNYSQMWHEDGEEEERIMQRDSSNKPSSTPQTREDYERARARTITQQVNSRSDKEKQEHPGALDYVNMAIPKKPGAKSMGDPTRDREHLLNALGQGDRTAIHGLHDWHQDNPGHEQEQDIADLKDHYVGRAYGDLHAQKIARSMHAHLTNRKPDKGDLVRVDVPGYSATAGTVNVSGDHEGDHGIEGHFHIYIPHHGTVIAPTESMTHDATYHLNQLKEKRKQEGQKALGRRERKSITLPRIAPSPFARQKATGPEEWGNEIRDVHHYNIPDELTDEPRTRERRGGRFLEKGKTEGAYRSQRGHSRYQQYLDNESLADSPVSVDYQLPAEVEYRMEHRRGTKATGPEEFRRSLNRMDMAEFMERHDDGEFHLTEPPDDVPYDEPGNTYRTVEKGKHRGLYPNNP